MFSPCGRLPHFRLSSLRLGYTPCDPPGALIRRAHARPRTTDIRHSPEPLAADFHPHPGARRAGWLRWPGLLAAIVAVAVGATGDDPRLLDAALCVHRRASAYFVAGDR